MYEIIFQTIIDTEYTLCFISFIWKKKKSIFCISVLK